MNFTMEIISNCDKRNFSGQEWVEEKKASERV